MTAPRLAYFVTPHGYGHAARAAAVLEALGRRLPGIEIEILTTVPDWFFATSLSVPHCVRSLSTDVGLVQNGPFHADLDATVAALDRFWSDLPHAVDRLVATWGTRAPHVVVSDISPLGLEVGHRLAVPSVLVENFTWDWIYQAYRDDAPALDGFAERSAQSTAHATLHIQCEPVCRPVAGAVRVAPLGRTARADRGDTRRALGLDPSDRRPLVLLTLGGMGWTERRPEVSDDYLCVALGGVESDDGRTGVADSGGSSSFLHLPDRSPIYVPDLVRAADVVIAKLGYSTVAECYRAGARLGYIGRPGFPESPVLEAFVRSNLPSLEVGRHDDAEFAWSSRVADLLALPAGAEREANGADEVVEHLLRLL